MTNTACLRRIIKTGIIPIIRSSNKNAIFICAEAMVGAGLPILEISLSVPGADETIRELAKKFGDSLLLGAGTIRSKEDADLAISNGANFIVCPHSNEEIIGYCQSKSFVVIPGAVTPTEIEKAWKCGADAIKVFPCNALGGPSYIQSIKAPFPDITLFPCGGVCLENVGQYIEAKADAVFVGSALCHMQVPEAFLFDAVSNSTFLLINKIGQHRKKAL